MWGSDLSYALISGDASKALTAGYFVLEAVEGVFSSFVQVFTLVYGLSIIPDFDFAIGGYFFVYTEADFVGTPFVKLLSTFEVTPLLVFVAVANLLA